MNDYKAGELIIYTEGCYSDYSGYEMLIEDYEKFIKELKK